MYYIIYKMYRKNKPRGGGEKREQEDSFESQAIHSSLWDKNVQIFVFPSAYQQLNSVDPAQRERITITQRRYTHHYSLAGARKK